MKTILACDHCHNKSDCTNPGGKCRFWSCPGKIVEYLILPKSSKSHQGGIMNELKPDGYVCYVCKGQFDEYVNSHTGSFGSSLRSDNCDGNLVPYFHHDTLVRWLEAEKLSFIKEFRTLYLMSSWKKSIVIKKIDSMISAIKGTKA